MNLLSKILVTLLISAGAIFYPILPSKAQEVNLNDGKHEVSPIDRSVLIGSQSLQGIEAKHSNDWLWASDNNNVAEPIEITLAQDENIGELLGVGDVIFGDFNLVQDEFFHEDDGRNSARIKLFQF
jgi:hypothetical protein